MKNTFLQKITRIRESINLKLYNSKDKMLKSLRWIGGIVGFITLLSLVYYHGYKVDEETKTWILRLLKTSIGIYIIKFVIEFIYSFQPWEHLKQRKFEGFLILFLSIDIVWINVTGNELVTLLSRPLGFEHLTELFFIFIQVYFVVLLLLELGKASTILELTSWSPPALLTMSFILLILVGTLLLMLPEMTVHPGSMPLLDALFTSISASCVTGLIVVDTATYFTFKGQLLIMLLIQMGGLNIISFATVFALFSKKQIGIRHQSIIQASFSDQQLDGSNQLFKQIVRFTLFFELAGTALLFFSWGPNMTFRSFADKLFYSVFHTVSAFNNAGFALFSDGLFEEQVRGAYFLHMWIAVLIILGGLGFATIKDVFSIKGLKERFTKPWIHLRTGTKISIYSAGILIVLGTIVFFVLENNNTLAALPAGGDGWLGKLVTSFFQSVTTRTAGFNTVDIGSLTLPILVFFMFLMFIGASTGSTGGGIKTSTFTLVLLSAYSTIRGIKNLEIFKQRIPWELLNKAFSIFLFSASFIIMGIFGLSITDSDIPFQKLAFEEVSAFCTAGLSTGITTELSFAGRVIIMLSMFIGRVGTLTLAFALSKKKVSRNYKYPKTTLMVG